jgi:hypothetical protein
MEELAFFGFFVGLPVATLALGAAWLSARRRANRLEHLVNRLVLPDERLDMIDQRLDAIAARLDQLARGQEFLGRLLAKGPGRSRRSAEQPGSTPH